MPYSGEREQNTNAKMRYKTGETTSVCLKTRSMVLRNGIATEQELSNTEAKYDGDEKPGVRGHDLYHSR